MKKENDVYRTFNNA